jgi:hypothetical protein
MSIWKSPEPPIEPPEPDPVGYCSHCSCEVYTDVYLYKDSLLCDRCYAFANSREAILKFAESYPKDFFQYLKEIGIVSEFKPILDMLDDYKDYAEYKFDEWVVS